MSSPFFEKPYPIDRVFCFIAFFVFSSKNNVLFYLRAR